MNSLSTLLTYLFSVLMTTSLVAQDYLIPARSSSLWGYIDREENWVIKDLFDDATRFSQGLAAVKYYEKWGYINKNGEWVIQPEFEKAKSFSEGFASVYRNGKWGFIDKSGRWTIEPEYDMVSSFSEGYAVIFNEKGFQYIDKSGNLLDRNVYQIAKPFAEGLASVIHKGRKGYVNLQGQLVIEHDFDNADTFSEGLAVVGDNGKYGYINHIGSIMIPLIYKDANHFSEGLASVKQGNAWGYADKTGQLAIETEFEYAGNFENGLAVVRKDGRYGLIDTHGDWVIQPKYRDLNEVGKTISLEEELVTLIRIRMNGWQRKGEFEKSAAYMDRVTEENRLAQLKLQSQVATNELANKYIDLDLAELGMYNADAEIFTLYIPGMLPSLIPVPIDEAMWFKANWERAEIIYPQFGLINEKFMLLKHVTVLDDRSYAYDAEEHGVNTTIFQVNPELGELEIHLPQNPITQIIVTDDNTTSALPGVDMDIPENPIIQSNVFALVIGNEDYMKYQVGGNQSVNVDFASNDAIIFSKYLNKTFGIPQENITLLVNGTAGQIRQALSKMKALAKAFEGEAEFIFYYAGHGLPNEETRDPYLIPVDVAPSDLSYAISLEELYNYYTANEARKVTMFLDACFSGGARNEPLLASRGIRIRPKSPFVMGNLMVFSASRGDQSAHAYEEEKHGIFTWHVLKKFQETGGYLSYGDLAYYLDGEVNKRSLLVNDREQEPTIKVSPILENTWRDFTFLNYTMQSNAK